MIEPMPPAQDPDRHWHRACLAFAILAGVLAVRIILSIVRSA